MDYETAFKKPFTDMKKLLIGVLLGIVPIINFFVSGYIVKTAKKTIDKDSSLPEWHEWGDLFVNGILYTVIGFIFMLPALVVGLISVWPVLPSMMSAYMAQLTPDAAVAMPRISEMMAGGMVGGLAITAILVLIAAYILPSAIVHFANNGFGAAFKLGNVFRTAFTGRYFLAWLIFAVYSSVLSGLLSRVPYVGSPVATFIAGITGFTLLAGAFSPAEPVKKAVKKAVVKKKKKK
ncbi:MAG: DUF4013 domain-containing protein [Nanoarchaeota archaeon]|nr:DUF4013 domain-containing protein [Nanoarchaeota archaeon]